MAVGRLQAWTGQSADCGGIRKTGMYAFYLHLSTSITMPASRSSKASAHSGKPYDSPTSRRPKKSFGPVSDQDPDIAAFDGVCAAREFNDARIASVLKKIVPCPPKKDWIQRTPSKTVSRPRFSSGKNGSELGRWYQVVSKTAFRYPTIHVS